MVRRRLPQDFCGSKAVDEAASLTSRAAGEFGVGVRHPGPSRNMARRTLSEARRRLPTRLVRLRVYGRDTRLLLRRADGRPKGLSCPAQHLGGFKQGCRCGRLKGLDVERLGNGMPSMGLRTPGSSCSPCTWDPARAKVRR